MDGILGKIKQRIYQLPYDQLPELIKEYTKAYPYQTAFQIMNSVVCFAPGLLTGPLLAFLGFAPADPAYSEPPAVAAPSCSWLTSRRVSCEYYASLYR